ncbi:hypothetical protein NDU88_006078 [Pleurodeles waltl]|uniref:Uncharacterized protein n=1 Tax=Pleurodeles waltl TaxID=8319 RepID=A0AAV7L6P1_PLEWA|nr:hypothetical protein NDU88_006078 [Pleurodeles waltl]
MNSNKGKGEMSASAGGQEQRMLYPGSCWSQARGLAEVPGELLGALHRGSRRTALRCQERCQALACCSLPARL